MIVELVGESGCGKSTLGKCIYENIEGARKKDSLTTKDNLKALIKVLSKTEARRLFFAYFSLEIKENGLVRLLRNTLYVAGLINTLQKEKEGKEIWIIDQGLIQFLQTVYYYKAPKNNRYAAIIHTLVEETDYRVVACQCDYETLISRIKIRKNNEKVVERRIEHAGKELFSLHENNLQLFLEKIPNNKKISVDTSGDLHAGMDRVCDFIRCGR